jgi:hypothetical protein
LNTSGNIEHFKRQEVALGVNFGVVAGRGSSVNGYWGGAGFAGKGERGGSICMMRVRGFFKAVCGTLGNIQGTFGNIQGSFGIVQETSGITQETSGFMRKGEQERVKMR